MKFDMSAAWRDAVAMMTANREVLLIVAGLFFLLPNVVLALSVGDLEQAMASVATIDDMEAQMYAIYADWWWLLALVVLAQIVGFLALLALLRDSSRPTVGEALKTGVVGLLPAFGAYILLTIGLSLVIGVFLVLAGALGSGVFGALIGIVAFVLIVYIGVKVSLSGPVIAIDRVFNPVRVLTRSWQLTKGNSFRLFLFYMLLGIVYLIVSMLLVPFIGAVTLMLGPDAALMVSGVFSGLLSAVVGVVMVAIIASVHRQLSGPSPAAVSETFE